jgi:hypothetical protein
VQALTQDEVIERWTRRWPAYSTEGAAAMRTAVTGLHSVGLVVVPVSDLADKAPLEPTPNGDLPVGVVPDPDQAGEYFARLHRVPADGSWEVRTSSRDNWQQYQGGATEGAVVVHARRRLEPQPLWRVTVGDLGSHHYPWMLHNRGSVVARFRDRDLADKVRDLLADFDAHDRVGA